MAIESVGNVGMGNIATYQATKPKAVEHTEPVKSQPRPQTTEMTAKPQMADMVKSQTKEESANQSDVSQFSATSTLDTLKDQNEISQEKLHKALDDINKKLSSTSCEYGYDDVTNRVTIKIIDKETDEIIRELPPEKTLEMIAKAWELAGILVDERL